MSIYFDYDSENYSFKNRKLGNCITVDRDGDIYHYEFDVNKNQATIICDDLKYIEYAIDAYRKRNPYITTFYTADKAFYKALDECCTFKLPIKCIQPSKFFVNEKAIEAFEEYLNEDDEIFIPVAIINDEYVCLDGHARLVYLHQNYEKLVNVYLQPYQDYINDFVYLAKENNISNVSNIKILPEEKYESEWLGFIKDYFEL